jgi:hypothetical protein
VTDEEIIELGEALTTALRVGDEEAWMALLDMNETAARQQRDWFASVLAVPMDVREMHPVKVLSRDRMGLENSAVVDFGFRHQITGADPEPVVEDYEVTLQRGPDGRVRVIEVGGMLVDGLVGYPQLWDLAPVAVVQDEHVIVLVDAAAEQQAVAMLAGMEKASASALADFEVPGKTRVAVTLASPEHLRRISGEPEAPSTSSFTIHLPASPEVSQGYTFSTLTAGGRYGARTVSTPELAEHDRRIFGPLDGGNLSLRHHLVRVMEIHRQSEFAAAWPTEGLSSWYRYAGDWDTLSLARDAYQGLVDAQGPPDELPPADWDAFEPGDWDQEHAHQLAALAVYVYVEERYGREQVFEVGRRLHAVPPWGDLDASIDEGLREVLGIGLSEFEADWLEWVAQSFG